MFHENISFMLGESIPFTYGLDSNWTLHVRPLPVSSFVKRHAVFTCVSTRFVASPVFKLNRLISAIDNPYSIVCNVCVCCEVSFLYISLKNMIYSIYSQMFLTKKKTEWWWRHVRFKILQVNFKLYDFTISASLFHKKRNTKVNIKNSGKCINEIVKCIRKIFYWLNMTYWISYKLPCPSINRTLKPIAHD